MTEDQPCPRITVVTPSFNQALFLEAAIRSVLLQGYPDIEYIVLDGGSTDDSAAIIAKYGPWLRHWESGKDDGQSDAINRGMQWGSGLWAAWINSDDALWRNALKNHVSAHPFRPDVVYAGICQHIDEAGEVVGTHQGRVNTLEDLVRIRQVWRSAGFIDQPAVLFPLELFRSVGGLNVENHRTMDYELWGKFFMADARIQYTDVSFGAFRSHAAQKTGNALDQTASLLETAASLVHRSGCFDQFQKDELLADLAAYHAEYQESYWLGSGRLARLGLSPAVVNLLRDAKDLFLKSTQPSRGTRQ